MSSSIIRFIDKVCVQTAVYWPTPVADGYGQMNYGVAEEVKVRWDGVSDVKVLKDGQEVIPTAKILINQALELFGYLYLGTLDDLDSDPEPITSGASQIIQIKKTPLFKSTTEFVYQVFVQ